VNGRPTRLNPLRLDRGEGRVRCRIRSLAPVQFHRYTTNYGGPLRASDARAPPPRPRRFPSPLWGDFRCLGSSGRNSRSRRPVGPGEQTRASQRVRRTDEVRRPIWRRAPGGGSNSAFDLSPPAEPKPLPGGDGCFRPAARIREIENHEPPTMLRMVFDQTAIFSQN
jgi:hypothetical protein